MGSIREKVLTDLVRTLWATDAFAPEPIPGEDLDQILQAGLEAPIAQDVQGNGVSPPASAIGKKPTSPQTSPLHDTMIL
jgi:hypothetical protein